MCPSHPLPHFICRKIVYRNFYWIIPSEKDLYEHLTDIEPYSKRLQCMNYSRSMGEIVGDENTMDKNLVTASLFQSAFFSFLRYPFYYNTV
jgi:hypothetical protein